MGRKKSNIGDSTGGSEPADQTNTFASAGGEAPAAMSVGGDVNIAAYWKRILMKKRKLIKERSNDELYEIWKKEHPGYSEVPKNWQQGLSNVKSILRKKKGKRLAAPVEKETASVADNGPPPAARSVRLDPDILETLEHLIDECLMVARKVDAEPLQEVISHLRKARHEVVWKMQS